MLDVLNSLLSVTDTDLARTNERKPVLDPSYDEGLDEMSTNEANSIESLDEIPDSDSENEHQVLKDIDADQSQPRSQQLKPHITGVLEGENTRWFTL